ncbi:uncharacterized protein JN550_007547 [Neoarthrinium moseri]|uniref:uncharacterized protein n=1 Tax=Neoarthrinium moseri TaxID=1658444 RepID=UPI001FDE7542|nr:uncharacterized protein JN550_007547 [Neoarthrinium moseri]KAI1866694.1 hypothetical protein JN550_007547 [Neoarthrinium moseri]
MEALAALSFCCNVLQLVSFAGETVSLCKNVYNGQPPDADFKDNVEAMVKVSSQIRTQTKPSGVPDSNAPGVKDVANKCNIIAQALKDEYNHITRNQKTGSILSTVNVAARHQWRRNRLERLESSLRDIQSTMDTYLLADLCKQSAAAQEANKASFRKLDTNLQCFITQCAKGERSVTTLIQREAVSTREAIDRSMKQQSKSINARVTVEAEATRNHTKSEVQQVTHSMLALSLEKKNKERQIRSRDRFIQSLKFEGMNERFNQVSDSHHKTFRWILTCHDDSVYWVSDEEDRELDNSPPGDTKSLADSEPNDSGAESQEDSRSTASSSVHEQIWDCFHCWLNQDDKLYWIQGKPGSGKSTLMKHLVQNPATKAAVRTASPGILILHHFFWKPGSSMQNSIKGLYCTLLYQLLVEGPEDIDGIIRKDPAFARKDHVSDWSTCELQSLCIRLFRHQSSLVCLFIDGLDEVSKDDGAINLVTAIKTMVQLPNVKACVSSRPETAFLARLETYPHLRLQDLNHRDIKKFCTSTLASHWHNRVSEKARASILNETLHKAEGVFLWAALAVREIITGLDNDDSEHELQTRVNRLPSELYALYLDMWRRLNDDRILYQQEAAWYFKLLLEWVHTPGHLHYDGYGDRDSIPLLRVVAASDKMVQRTVLEKNKWIDSDVLHDLLDKTLKKIGVRCAGLLTTTPRERDLSVKAYAHHYDKLRPRITYRTTFIHRTAIDFLVDTKEGQQILQYCPTSEDELSADLVKGYLIQWRIFETTRFAQSLRMDMLHCMFRGISHLTTLPEKELFELLDICRNEIESGYFGSFVGSSLVLTARPRFTQYVLSRILQSPEPVSCATSILRDMWDARKPISQNLDHPGCYVEPLLALGARSNVRGICQGYILDHEYHASPFMIADTAFWRFLKWTVLLGELQLLQPGEFLHLLQSYLASEPDLACRTQVSIEFGNRTAHYLPDNWLLSTAGLPGLSENRPVFTIETNLVFFIETLMTWLAHQNHDGSKVTFSDVLEGIASRNTEPVFRLRFVTVGPRSVASSYCVVNQRPSDQITSQLKGWVRSQLYQEIIDDDLVAMASKTCNEIALAESGNYQKVDEDFRAILAREGVGFAFAENCTENLGPGTSNEVSID